MALPTKKDPYSAWLGYSQEIKTGKEINAAGKFTGRVFSEGAIPDYPFKYTQPSTLNYSKGGN